MTRPHALLIGGTRGLGRATAGLFAARDHRVSVIARHLPGPGAGRSPSIRHWAADVRDEAAIRAAVREILRVQGPPGSVVFFQRYRGGEDPWEGEMATTLTATRRFIELLVESHDLRQCALVVVSSINAHLVSTGLGIAYHVAKAGLNQMVRYYAVALGSRGIRVNSVSPGTFLKEESRHTILDDSQLSRLYQRMIPLGKLCSAEEVAKVIYFLASDDASFVNGQDLIVDGGLSLQFQEVLGLDLVRARRVRRPRKPLRT